MDEYIIKTSFISPTSGIVHTNRMKLRPMPDYLQVWLKSGELGSGSIRLDDDQIDGLIAYLQKFKSRT